MRVLGSSRRISIVAAGLAALAAAAFIASPAVLAAPAEVTATPAGAKPVEEHAGSVVVGTPVASQITLNWFVAGCDPASGLNGVESVMYDVRKLANHYAEVTPEATLDADVWFWDEECAYIDHHDEDPAKPYDDNLASGDVAVVERGYIPPNAAYAEVGGFAGTGGFTFTVFDVTR